MFLLQFQNSFHDTTSSINIPQNKFSHLSDGDNWRLALSYQILVEIKLDNVSGGVFLMTITYSDDLFRDLLQIVLAVD